MTQGERDYDDGFEAGKTGAPIILPNKKLWLYSYIDGHWHRAKGCACCKEGT